MPETFPKANMREDTRIAKNDSSVSFETQIFGPGWSREQKKRKNLKFGSGKNIYTSAGKFF